MHHESNRNSFLKEFWHSSLSPFCWIIKKKCYENRIDAVEAGRFRQNAPKGGCKSITISLISWPKSQQEDDFRKPMEWIGEEGT
jgi:hypothetical protein